MIDSGKLKTKLVKLYFFLKRIKSIATSFFYHFRLVYLKKHVKKGTNPNSSIDLIVSLTTLPHRLKHTLLSINSLLTQTLRPKKIILWIPISENQAIYKLSKKEKDLFEKFKQAGLEVMQTKDIGPLTKFLPTFEEYPDAIIVTSDDDIIYPKNWLKDLYSSYLKSPKNIHCYRAHKMNYNLKEELLEYSSWEFESNGNKGPCLTLFPTGVYGVLYPPGSLSNEILNRKLYKKLSYKADDVWLKAMSLLKSTPCEKVFANTPKFFEINFFNKGALNKTNVHKSQNDIYIQKVWKHYFN